MTSAVRHTTAKTMATHTATAAGGLPQSAPKPAEVTTPMTARLTAPVTKPDRALPSRISTGRMGAARIRSTMPCARSTKKLRAVKLTVNRRKKIAMAGA